MLEKNQTLTFTLDGKDVSALEGETIWEVAKRTGTTIPHLCHANEVGYRADGNCRACMVEVEGERTLVASCTWRGQIVLYLKTMSFSALRLRRGGGKPADQRRPRPLWQNP